MRSKSWCFRLGEDRKVFVVSYVEEAEGTIETTQDGGCRFTVVHLRPWVLFAMGNIFAAGALHE